MGEGWKMEPPSSLVKPLIQDSSGRCAFYAWRKIVCCNLDHGWLRLAEVGCGGGKISRSLSLL